MKTIFKIFGVLVGSLFISIGINLFVELGVMFVLHLVPMVFSNIFSCASAPAVDFSVIDDIMAYIHGDGSIRIVFTVYLLGIILSAIISSCVLYGVCRLTNGSKVLSLLMIPMLAIYFFKCCADVFGGTGLFAGVIPDGGIWTYVVSIAAVIMCLLLSVGAVAASWNKLVDD